MNGPIPTRVDSAVKAWLLALVEDAAVAGWPLSRICGLLEIDGARVWRWKHRQLAGELEDAPPGGNPVHGVARLGRSGGPRPQQARTTLIPAFQAFSEGHHTPLLRRARALNDQLH